MFERGICFFLLVMLYLTGFWSRIQPCISFSLEKGLGGWCYVCHCARSGFHQPTMWNQDCAGIAFRLPIMCDINAADAMAAQIKLRLLMERSEQKKKKIFKYEIL